MLVGRQSVSVDPTYSESRRIRLAGGEGVYRGAIEEFRGILSLGRVFHCS